MSNTPPPVPTPRDGTPADVVVGRCANCGTPGSGKYCGSCGQRLDVHLHSVGHFVAEAAEVLTHSDSSLWKTLWPLLARPGELTREFIAGRRARYLQPFRLYLVASVLLLLATTLGDGHGGGKAELPASAAPAAASPSAPASVEADNAGDRVVIDPSGNVLDVKPGDCTHVTTDAPWMRPFIPALKGACRSIVADNGRELVHSLLRNAGRAMFVFLPLLAAFMKLLYWRPKRWYLEHLLLLHNHAFIYLFFALLVLVTHPLPAGWIASLLATAAVLYSLRYLYKSMRNYYGQGRALTLLKFAVLGFAYCVAGFVTFMLTAFVTAVTL